MWRATETFLCEKAVEYVFWFAPGLEDADVHVDITHVLMPPSSPKAADSFPLLLLYGINSHFNSWSANLSVNRQAHHFQTNTQGFRQKQLWGPKPRRTRHQHLQRLSVCTAASALHLSPRSGASPGDHFYPPHRGHLLTGWTGTDTLLSARQGRGSSTFPQRHPQPTQNDNFRRE